MIVFGVVDCIVFDVVEYIFFRIGELVFVYRKVRDGVRVLVECFVINVVLCLIVFLLFWIWNDDVCNFFEGIIIFEFIIFIFLGFGFFLLYLFVKYYGVLVFINEIYVWLLLNCCWIDIIVLMVLVCVSFFVYLWNDR